MSGKLVSESLDPTGIGIAIAMRHTGFSDEDIVSVRGYMPNLNITPAELEEAVAAELASSADSDHG